MLKDDALHKQFVSTVSDWLNKGYAKYVDVSETDQSYFIPTFMVVRLLSHTTQYRLIMNGKLVFEDGICINDLLLAGPNMMNLIVEILLAFGEGDFGVTCDLASMFLKVKVPESDQHCLRFFFRESPDQPLRVVQCLAHVFGLRSSPFVAMSTLRKHAQDRKETHPHATKALLHDIIVDDILTSSDKVEDLTRLVEELDSMLPEINMSCHKFAANDERILQSVAPERRAKEAKLAKEDMMEEKTPEEKDKPVEKVKTLGVVWNCIDDTFQINYSGDETEPVTLRTVMRNCMRFYDQMGWFLPVQIGGRMLVQVAWRLQHEEDWDKELPLEFQKTFRKWIVDAKEINQHKIPRCHKKKGEKVKKRVLAVFCDASSLAYAACGYLVHYYENPDVEPTTRMVFSRGKVASTTKRQTIARLEAAACVLGVDLARQIVRKLKIEMEEVRLFTDSSTCLYWFQTRKELSVYVGARVCHVRDYTRPCQWGHVRTKQNPADLPSRAVRSKTLMKSKLWENGAEWLIEPPENWPRFRTMLETPASREETKEITSTLEKIFIQVAREVQLVTDRERKLAILIHIVMGRYYALRKSLRKATECVNDIEKWMGRALDKGLDALAGVPKRQEQEFFLTTQKGLFKWLIKMDQRKFFAEDIQALLKNGDLRRQFDQYNLFLDSHGLLRISGRLKHTQYAAADKFCPVLLHPESALTESIVRDIHEHRTNLDHSGGPMVLWNEVRMHYFLLNGKQYCKNVLASCPGCQRRKTHRIIQEDGPTHWSRIPKEDAQNFVFERVGIDMAGPFMTRSTPGKPRNKRWFIIFACMVTRAVNIEMVEKSDGNSLYLAYKRHCSLFGRSKYINSDNGSNMKYLDRTLKALWGAWEKLMENVLVKEEGVQYVRNPPYAPWWGGNYESLIFVIKRIMKATIKWPKHYLNDEELRTAFREISALMNVRPLTIPSSNANDHPALRPCDFFTSGQAVPGVTPVVGQEFPVGLTKLKENVDKAVKVTWDRFQKELFHKLNVTRKRQKRGIKLKEGDVVLVANSEWPNETWPLGRVISITKNQDQEVISAEIYSNGVTLKRSVRNLARLPVLCTPSWDRYLLYRKPGESKKRK